MIAKQDVARLTSGVPDRRGGEGPDLPDRPRLRGPVLAGLTVIVLFFGGLGFWASVAPLDGAAIALGQVSVDTNRRTIQHLEGGIVGEILVRDGDVVETGQVLLRLDETRPRATLELLEGRRIAAAALEARLIAERDGSRAVDFPDWLLDRLAEAKVADAIAGQVRIFETRRKAMDERVAIQDRRISQLQEEILGLRGAIESQTRQLALIREEIQDVQGLYDVGYARKPRLLALRRQDAEIEGSRSQNNAAVARAEQSIGEAEIRVSELRTERLNEVVLQLRTVQSERFELAERLKAVDDMLVRLEIRAPISGTIVGLRVHTTGGVISPGARLMDIVPSNDRLIVEAQVELTDIDVVHAGLPAQVRLTPFSARRTAPVAGRVTSVSADRVTDGQTGRSFYLARIELTDDLADKLEGGRLYPGMPAEVMISTGARTALDYILGPIAASLDRAFREQ